MTDAAEPRDGGPRTLALAAGAGLTSAAILGFEVGLMRLLLVAGWHHFAFVVISVALLGFGAGGTVLTLARPWFERHASAALLALTAATAVSMPLCAQISQSVAVDPRFLPALWDRQLAAWIAYWAILFVPFLLGASSVGLAVMMARRRVAVVYAANLLGSGAGALVVPLVAQWIWPQWLPLSMGLLALGAAACLPDLRPSRRWTAVLVAAGILAAWAVVDPPRIRVDPFKYGAFVNNLVRQGQAERIAAAAGPRGVVEIYRSEAFHDLPFLSVESSPPPLDALLIDGHWAGSVLRVDGPEEARAVDHTLPAAAYGLAPSRPRVLLLGETAGPNIWLAIRKGARSVHAVQPNGDVYRLLSRPLLDRAEVRAIVVHPRHFVDQARDRFDLIQLVMLETFAAGSGGLGGLAEDHLMTVEGMTACLDRLFPEGLISVSRGIQTPPRDNLKMLATFVDALRRSGVAEPSRHVVIFRDYLSVSTIVRRTPWSEGDGEKVRRLCAERQLTPVWFPGIRHEELNQPDALPGPPGETGDWYHYAAVRLFSPGAERFIDEWAFDIRPPNDDRPFFADFLRMSAAGRMREAYGEIWLTRVEMAFLFVLGSMVIVAVAGAALLILPLAFRSRRGGSPGRLPTVSFFTAIGLGYLMVEMAWMSRLTRLMGDATTAAAVTIASFLVFSGLGAFAAERGGSEESRRVRRAVVGIFIAAAFELIAFGPIIGWAGAHPALLRGLACALLVAPLAFPMGFLMPLGLRRLDAWAPDLVPWGWAANGFASVLAAPLATAIGMTWGFSYAVLAALGMYVGAAAIFVRLPVGNPPGQPIEVDRPSSPGKATP